MRLITSIKQGVLVVRLEGEIDMHAAEAFKNSIDDALASSGVKNVRRKWKGVSWIESSGLGVILGRYKKVNQLGGKLLAAHAHPRIAKVFELSGLLQVVHIYDTENQALESL
ncbi:MAG: anti-sigma factor antagonist [Negativicutes bacterium]|nr:anti-sigma factor antagonist [Negativicutes bacterium]